MPGLPVCESVWRITKLTVFLGSLRAVPHVRAAWEGFLSSRDLPPPAGDSPRTTGPPDLPKPKPPNPNHRPTIFLFQEEFRRTLSDTARGLYPPRCTHEAEWNGAVRGHGLPGSDGGIGCRLPCANRWSG